MKFEIKSRWTGSVLFSVETETLKLAVELGVQSGANLYGADLYGADLSSAKNSELATARTSIVAEGNIVGWTKCRSGVIVKLLIPQKARRSNATGRKCRSEYVKVLQVFGSDEGVSIYSEAVVYRKGETVKCDSWQEDRFIECGGGIHFYLTRIEAENHS